MKKIRVNAYIDGFNLYHAIDELGLDHLKWVNLRELCEQFIRGPQYSLRNVYYFSAFAYWRPLSAARHRLYVKALKVVGVIPVLGKFKEQRRRCRHCGQQWTFHEEKESDVNAAMYLTTGALRDEYDRALLITRDSDLSPPVRLVCREFSEKQVRIITPPGRGYSWDLFNAAGGRKHSHKMKRIHVERSLFPKEVRDNNGKTVVTRPTQYDPPV
jgi:uncharacterized LabA/DUF88 family protein